MALVGLWFTVVATGSVIFTSNRPGEISKMCRQSSKLINYDPSQLYSVNIIGLLIVVRKL